MLLDIRNLSVELTDGKKIVDQASLQVREGSILGVVGGSGSGKTTVGLSVMGLLAPALKVTSGKVFFGGQNILSYREEQMRALRGARIAMVFQEPLDAFNPVFTVGFQIDEVLRFHCDFSKKQRRIKVLEVLDAVGIKDPERVARTYPHELSGGMRQRAMLAMAIAARPQLIIADEPTSNLDVTLQARVMDLLRRLKEEQGLSIILITHDLGLVGHAADEVIVMSQGKVVEKGETARVLQEPQQEYTRQLLKALE